MARLSLMLTLAFFCASMCFAAGKRGQLQISPSNAKKCDHAVAEGMALFYNANTAFEARKGTNKPISDAENELLGRIDAAQDDIGRYCFVSLPFAGDPVDVLMKESHWQLAQERYALQIELLMRSTMLDIVQNSRRQTAKAIP